jgi:hypothetical protein
MRRCPFCSGKSGRQLCCRSVAVPESILETATGAVAVIPVKTRTVAIWRVTIGRAVPINVGRGSETSRLRGSWTVRSSTTWKWYTTSLAKRTHADPVPAVAAMQYAEPIQPGQIRVIDGDTILFPQGK